ncbi:DUF3344 domain-containing protein [Streptomyces sp. NPDC048436]|uniref:DUF3344 domain-containing protein n=1 Tax=Streptomyces sp. NPDC048436 TaxID=3365550 RepID=UPI00371C22EC
MRHSVGPLLRRVTLCAFSLAVVAAPGGPALAVPSPPAAEAPSIEFAQRYHALQRGGITRAANTSHDYDMSYVDVDRDSNTYNSSRGEVRLPKGSRVSYARLYWGDNLRVGEQKPAEDNGMALIAEPGGSYQDVRADTLVGHRAADEVDAFQASADVTPLVRAGGEGLYTVAQVNAARGHFGADSFDARRRGHVLRLSGAPVPARASGDVGMVTYNGDRGMTGDTLTVSSGGSRPQRLSDAANPADDVLNSTISEPGRQIARKPAYTNTLGYDSDIFRLDRSLKADREGLLIRLASQRESAWAGVLFTAVDAKR